MVKDAVPLGECGRALVIKLRHHGDVLLAAPVLSVLKARGLEVDALVYDDTAPMLEGHPALSRLHLLARQWKLPDALRLLRDLKARRYGLLVMLSDQTGGAWLARSLGARYSVAPLIAGRGRFWTKSFTHLFPVAARRHDVELNLDALRRIGVQPGLDERKVQFVPGPEAERKVEALVRGEFVHCHPAGRSDRWPARKHAELIDRFAADGRQVVITAAPKREELGFVDEILNACKSRPRSLAGELSVKQLGALTARAKLFFGVDAMPMHLACAMGTPVVALFGSTGEVERGPWHAPHRVLRLAHPCAVSVDTAYAAAGELLR